MARNYRREKSLSKKDTSESPYLCRHMAPLYSKERNLQTPHSLLSSLPPSLLFFPSLICHTSPPLFRYVHLIIFFFQCTTNILLKVSMPPVMKESCHAMCHPGARSNERHPALFGSCIMNILERMRPMHFFFCLVCISWRVLWVGWGVYMIPEDF